MSNELNIGGKAAIINESNVNVEDMNDLIPQSEASSKLLTTFYKPL